MFLIWFKYWLFVFSYISGGRIKLYYPWNGTTIFFFITIFMRNKIVWLFLLLHFFILNLIFFVFNLFPLKVFSYSFNFKLFFFFFQRWRPIAQIALFVNFLLTLCYFVWCHTIQSHYWHFSVYLQLIICYSFKGTYGLCTFFQHFFFNIFLNIFFILFFIDFFKLFFLILILQSFFYCPIFPENKFYHTPHILAFKV